MEHSAERTFSDQSENFPLFSTNSKIPKIYLSGPTTVRSSSKKSFLKKWHPSSRNLSKKFQFSKLNSDFIGKFSDLQLSPKFVKNDILGPKSVRSFSEIQRETFEVEIFPIFSTSIFFFLQNCKNWNILQRELFSEKSEIFPLFPLTRKFRKFIYPGL